MRLVAAAVFTWSVVAVSAQGPPPALSPAETAKVVARGKVVYAEQKCSACHMIASEGNKRSGLDGVGSRLKASDVKQWIVAPRKMKATVRKPDYTKMPASDLDALVAYLMTLTKK